MLTFFSARQQHKEKGRRHGGMAMDVQCNGNTRIINCSLRKFYFSLGMVTFLSARKQHKEKGRRQGGKTVGRHQNHLNEIAD